MKINLGSGSRHQEGFINIDINPSVNPDLVADISEGLPFEDSSVDYVRAFDFLEHIEMGKTIDVIDEIWRVLKPGGQFESFTPDAEYGQGAFQDPTHVSFWVENTWLYFTEAAWGKNYGIKSNFTMKALERVNTKSSYRIFHLHVLLEKEQA